MTKKKPAKKKIVPPAKRKYTKKVARANEPLAGPQHDGGGELECFKIEKYSGKYNRSTFALTEEYEKMEEALKKLKPREGFVIEKQWEMHPVRIADALDLKIRLKIVSIPEHPKFKRVVRVS